MEMIIYEPAHDKTYNKTCPASEYSNQPAHPHSLIRVFADCMSLRKHAYSNILKISPPKNWKFSNKMSDIFHISAQNIA